MAVRLSEIFVEIGARTASFQKGIAQAQTRLGRFGQSVTKVSSDNALALTAFAAAGALAFKSLVTTAGDFDSAMRSVRAVSRATEEQFKQLTATAEKLGRETQFSASQAAEGMEFLAKAGFDANEVLAAIPGTLQLAAAASLELGDAADIVTNVLTGFNLEVSELGRVNDILTQAFISSNTNLQELGQAMKFVGPVAASFGQEIEDVVAVLGSLGNAGIQASMAGTTLRGALTRLAAPSGEAAKILKRVGIEVFDSAGKMLPFIDILDDLGKSSIGATEVIKVFGLRAGPGIAALLAKGADGIRKFSDELKASAGITAEIAQVKMEGFTGAVLELRSAFEGLTISIAKSGVLEFAEELTRKLSGLLRVVSILPTEFLALAAGMAAVTFAGAGLLATIGLLALAGIKLNGVLLLLFPSLTGVTLRATLMAIAMKGATATAGFLTISLGALAVAASLLLFGLAVLAIGIFKTRVAMEEADRATKSWNDSLGKNADFMKRGFAIARFFNGVTAETARTMGDLNTTVKTLTEGIRNLSIAQAEAKRSGEAINPAIQKQIDSLKALRAELLQTKQAREDVSAAGVSTEQAQQRAFRATIAERSALLTDQLNNAVKKRDEASFAEAARQLQDLDSATATNEEFKSLFADKTNAQILEIAREQEAKAIGRQFDIEEDRKNNELVTENRRLLNEKRVADQKIIGDFRIAEEQRVANALMMITRQSSALFRTLFDKSLSAREKRQRVFLQVSGTIQKQITASLIKNLAKETAARKVAALKGIAADKAKTASGFFSAFSSIPFVGQALALAAIGAAFAFINSLLTFNKGGLVPGSGNRDTVPALLTPGEFVLSKAMVAGLAGGGGRGGPVIGQLIINDPIIDNIERVERLADIVSENLMDRLSGDRRGIVD